MARLQAVWARAARYGAPPRRRQPHWTGRRKTDIRRAAALVGSTRGRHCASRANRRMRGSQSVVQNPRSAYVSRSAVVVQPPAKATGLTCREPAVSVCPRCRIARKATLCRVGPALAHVHCDRLGGRAPMTAFEQMPSRRQARSCDRSPSQAIVPLEGSGRSQVGKCKPTRQTAPRFLFAFPLLASVVLKPVGVMKTSIGKVDANLTSVLQRPRPRARLRRLRVGASGARTSRWARSMINVRGPPLSRSPYTSKPRVVQVLRTLSEQASGGREDRRR
jgi:hypothetical protein